MPSNVAKSAIRPLSNAVGDQIATAFSNQGYSDADDRVWHRSPKSGTPHPYAIFAGRQQPSELMGNKDDDPVRGVVEIQVWSYNDVEPETLGEEIQAVCIDDANPPSVNGWRVVWHDLVFNEPVEEDVTDGEDRYGTIIEIEYQLDPQ